MVILCDFYQKINRLQEVPEKIRPSKYEELILSGEVSYLYITRFDEESGAYMIFEVAKDLSTDEICEVATEISGLNYGLNRPDATVYFENGQYIIKGNNGLIGRIATKEKKFGMLLYYFVDLADIGKTS